MSRAQRSTDLSSFLFLSLAALLTASPASAADVSVKLDAGSGFSIKNASGSIERLRVDEATGNISRNGALFVHTTGANNTFVGTNVGTNLTSGYDDTALGDSALSLNSSGRHNAAVGYSALRYDTVGYWNSAVGSNALRANTTGKGNSAFGYAALRNNSTGSFNSALGYSVLRFNTASGNSALGYAALRANTTGTANSAVGYRALWANTTGSFNSAFGYRSLRNNSNTDNSAFGYSSLGANNSGTENSAFGSAALASNTTGSDNSAFGFGSLLNSTGGSNTALGSLALFHDTTGARNVAVGYAAGINQTTGNDDIYLANAGVAAESGTIRIGTAGTHTATYVAGISGTAVSGSAVLVTAGGQLGVAVSSRRFKEAVEDLVDASDRVMALRPVRFRYRRDAGGDGRTQEYGLIAEEVAEVAPELVVLDAEGRPWSVKYHELPALLLKQAQQHQQVIAALSARIEALEARGGAGCDGADR